MKKKQKEKKKMSTKKAKWLDLGSITKSADKKDPTKIYRNLKFKDNVTVLKNGEEVDLTKYRSAMVKLKKEDEYVLAEIVTEVEGKIAEIRKGKPGKNNYIKFVDGISFKVDAVPFTANKDNVAQIKDPVTALEELIKRGFIKEEDVEKRREKTKEISSWLEYQVSLSPKDTTTAST
jgi:hypothetical protein